MKRASGCDELDASTRAIDARAAIAETRFMTQSALSDDALVSAMRTAVSLERDALEALAADLGAQALAAVRLMAGVKGRVICAGVGKSGHVARKIAATLASTGTPAQFVHPSEASHGDLGMITPDDAVLALSKSGETRELGDLIAYCRRFAVPLLGLTAKADSTLGRGADIALVIPDAPEACAETRAPTTSTTLMMAYGDALAIGLIEARGFTASQFARFHPGGALGSALASAEDLMHAGEAMPLIAADATMGEALIEMSQKGFGCVGVTGQDGRLIGIVTDGDLRRNMSGDLAARPVAQVMTADPMTASPGDLASDALRRMTAGARKITQLFVCEADGRPAGLLHIHDLLRAGVS